MESEIYASAEALFSGAQRVGGTIGQAADDISKAKDAISFASSSASKDVSGDITGLESYGFSKNTAAGVAYGARGVGVGIGYGGVAAGIIQGGQLAYGRINAPDPVRPGEGNRQDLPLAQKLNQVENTASQPVVVSGNNNVINELYPVRPDRIGGGLNSIPIRYDSQNMSVQPRPPIPADTPVRNQTPYLSGSIAPTKSAPPTAALNAKALPNAPQAPAMQRQTMPAQPITPVPYKPLANTQNVAPAPSTTSAPASNIASTPQGNYADVDLNGIYGGSG